MNLLSEPWLPVRDQHGQRAWITPDRLGEPQWRAFDANRPDFNGALAQFAIGLLQTTTPAADSIEWRGLFRAPPDAATLQRWFDPVRYAFELDGGGPRFMQDVDLGADGVAENGIGALLIESPGENTVRNNADHFVKRSQVRSLCPACAATALFTLQINAPTGGAGHRTGVRGGGPLTTLVVGPPGTALWQDLWINVRDRTSLVADAGDSSGADPQHSFPWLGPIDALQSAKGELAQSQVHPAHLFWAMPRRIRLELGAGPAGACDTCGRRAVRLVTHYRTRNYGLNYKGAWSHPLSPYYELKGEWLPMHPQSDGLGYRHWLAWVLGVSGERKKVRAAAVVERALNQLHRQTGGALRLWAFGYDMDNMKARCWFESTLPLYALAECDSHARVALQAEISCLLAGAEWACVLLRTAVKDAWLGGDARGDLSQVDASFWNDTEPAFYRQLKTLIDAARAGVQGPVAAQREGWHASVAQAALRLFDKAFVGAGPVAQQNPRRIALAHRRLRDSLYGPKLKQALGLAAPDSAGMPARKASRRSTTNKPKEEA